jgi:hypothetical protein
VSLVLIDGYPIDATLSEDHDHDADVTDHPVESGAAITDHVRIRPLVVSLEGIVSDSPIGDVAFEREEGAAHSADAYAVLLSILESREPVSIRTSLATYHNMILQRLSVPRSVDTGKSLRFRATFRQLILVTNARTTVKVAAPRLAKKSRRGNKAAPHEPLPPPPVYVPKVKDNRSMYERAIDGDGGAVLDRALGHVKSIAGLF